MKEQPLIGVLLIIGLILYTQKIPWQIKFIWGFFLLTTAYRSFWPYYQPDFAPTISNLLAWNTTEVLLILLAYPLFILNSTDRLNNNLLAVIKWYMAYDAIILLTGGRGVFSATTFDATLIACFTLLWNLKKKSNQIGLAICIGAIIYVKARNAAIILTLSYCIILIQWGIHRFKYWWIILSGLLTPGLLLIYKFSNGIIHDPRFAMWNSFMSWWQQHADLYFGTGLGTFEWVGPSLDPTKPFRDLGVGFYVMHNDWLQLLFEGGIIGLTLGIGGFLYVASRLKGKDFATWLGIGAGMLFYYPTHAWPIQILALVLISKCRNSIDSQEVYAENNSIQEAS